jgi:hypothetical protein
MRRTVGGRANEDERFILGDLSSVMPHCKLDCQYPGPDFADLDAIDAYGADQAT